MSEPINKKSSSTGSRLPLLLLAKTIDHVSETEPAKLNRDGMRRTATQLREVAIARPAK